MPSRLEKAQVMLTHLIQAKRSLENWISNESISIAGRIATGHPSWISGPEELGAAFALFTVKALVCEVFELIFVIREHIHQLIAGNRIGTLKGFLNETWFRISRKMQISSI